MAHHTSQYPLTEQNLAVHNQLLESHIIEPITLWVERVINEERSHQFHSQLSATMANLHARDISIELDLDHLDQQISSIAASGDLETTLASLKLFEQRSYTCLEGPLERFLTPGTGDVSYVSRQALADMGVQFGSMESSERRRMVARANVDLVWDRARGACEMSEIGP